RTGRTGGERKRGIVDFAIVFAASDEHRRNFESRAGDDYRSRREFKSANGRGDEGVTGESGRSRRRQNAQRGSATAVTPSSRSEEHTSELQSRSDLVCRLLLEKKKK